MNRLLTVLTTVALILTACTAPSGSAPPADRLTIGHEQGVPSPSKLGQSDPAVAFGGGHYLLVWQEGFNGAGGQSDILALRVGADGKLVDRQPIVVAGGPGVQDHPTVAFCAGRFLVVWSTLNERTGCDLGGAFVGSDGRVQPVDLRDRGDAIRHSPVVVSDGAGAFLVAWLGVQDGRAACHGCVLSAAGRREDAAALPLSKLAIRPSLAWVGDGYVMSQAVWTTGLDKQGRTRLPTTQSWSDYSANASAAVSAWGKGVVISHSRMYPDPWGWGGNAFVVGWTVTRDDARAEKRAFTELRGAFRKNKEYDLLADGKVPNCLDVSRWLNHPGWPMGMPGALKNVQDDVWPSGTPAAAFNGESVVVVWPRAHWVDSRRLRNRDLVLTRVLPGWGLVDRPVVPIAATAAEESDPVLAAGPKGQTLLAYAKVTPTGPSVVYRLLTELPDREPPKVRYVVPQSDTEWIVAFDEPIDAASVKAGAFGISGVNVTSAVLNPDGRGNQREVILTTDSAKPLIRGHRYALTVSGVKDRSPAANAVAGETFTFVAQPGVFQRSYFINRWAIVGPFPRDRKNHPFDVTVAQPTPGDKVGERTWVAVDEEALGLSNRFGGKNDQMAYASVYVYSTQARKAQLRMDSNDHHRAWVNGRLVRDGITGATTSRGFHDYTDISPIRLNAGWNRLLVQVENQVSTWAMIGQITDATGEPIRGLTFQVERPK